MGGDEFVRLARSMGGGNGLRRLLAFACVNAGCALVGYGWWLQFWGW